MGFKVHSNPDNSPILKPLSEGSVPVAGMGGMSTPVMSRQPGLKEREIRGS